MRDEYYRFLEQGSGTYRYVLEVVNLGTKSPMEGVVQSVKSAKPQRPYYKKTRLGMELAILVW